jgi:hypothetical protein
MAYGLRPVNTAGAGYHTGGFIEYKINTLGTAIFNGGCVTMTATGGIDALTDPVSNATTTAGVLVGARWINAAGEIKYGQYYDGVGTNTDAFAFVALASDTIFKVQGTTAFVDGHRGVPYNTSGTSGSTITGNSDLACTNGTAGSNPPLVVIDVVDDGTQSGSSTPDLLVRFASGAIQNLIG